MSTGMAIPGWIPVEACSARAQVPAIPAAMTTPPVASPKVRSFFSFSSSRLAYAPKRTATKSAEAPRSSSRETSAAPGLVSSADWRPSRSKAADSSPDPV